MGLVGKSFNSERLTIALLAVSLFSEEKKKEKEVVVMKQIKWWQENNVFLI